MKPQLKLGELIDKLKSQEQDSPVYYGLGYMAPGPPQSYRGYYDHLALDIQDETQPTVAEVLKWCEEAIGKTYEGYKGGDYTMNDRTPMWAAKYGESGSSAIVGVKNRGYCVELVVRRRD